MGASYNQLKCIGVVAGILATSVAFTSEEKPLPTDTFDSQILWIEPSGNTLPQLYPSHSDWVVRPPTLDTPVESLSFQTTVDLPAGYRLADLKGAPYTLDKHGKSESFSLETTNPVTTASIQIENPKGEKLNNSLLIRIREKEPMLWENSVCDQAGISLLPIRGNAKFLFAYVICKLEKIENREILKAYVFTSNNVNVKNTGPLRPTENHKWLLYQLDPKKLAALTSPALVATFSFTEKKRGKTEDLALFHGNQKSNNNLSFDIGFQVTSISYSENVFATAPLSISEVGLTLSGDLDYSFHQGKYSLSTSLSVLALPLSHSSTPVGSDAFRTFGISERFNYAIPRTFLGLHYLASAGVRVFGMLVPNNAYGVTNVTSPQFEMVATRDLHNGRSVSAFLGFSPISDSLGFSNLGSEINFGARYPVRIVGANSSICFDYMTQSFSFSGGTAQYKFSRIGLGLTFEF